MIKGVSYKPTSQNEARREGGLRVKAVVRSKCEQREQRNTVPADRGQSRFETIPTQRERLCRGGLLVERVDRDQPRDPPL